MDSGRENNSASNELIFNDRYMDNTGFLGQKLIFGPSKNA